MSRGIRLFCQEGRGLVQNDCPGGRVFAPFESCLGGLSRGGGGGMVLDEVDSCITLQCATFVEIVFR